MNKPIKSLVLFSLLFMGSPAYSWSNGQPGNATTNKASECDSPPYATHDGIADHALALLPTQEKAWILPHKTLYLMGTEAPDNSKIPAACGAPNTGYDDRSKGHSVEWKSDWSDFKTKKYRAAWRANEEYFKAVHAFKDGKPSVAAFYLGAMAHYIGDVSQFGHSVPFESKKTHGNYERWMATKTPSFDGGHFESFIVNDGLVKRRAWTAVKRISKVTGKGKGPILSARVMDEKYASKDEAFMKSAGHSLNLGVNELSDVLHYFYLKVVE